MGRLHAVVVVLASIIPAAAYGEEITADAAIEHVGQHATVCGVVASAKYAKGSKGQPTFLSLDKPYPNHIFTALIWGSDRRGFSYAPESLLGDAICVRGAITLFRGKAEIVVTTPSQITGEQVSGGRSTGNVR